MLCNLPAGEQGVKLHLHSRLTCHISVPLCPHCNDSLVLSTTVANLEDILKYAIFLKGRLIMTRKNTEELSEKYFYIYKLITGMPK
jgi:hypothetical protein